MTKPYHCAYPADYRTHTDGGLTKREYFASLAMQALLSDSQLNGYTPQQYAEGAVEYADALIKELNKQEDNGTD